MSKRSRGYRRVYKKQKWAPVVVDIQAATQNVNANAQYNWLVPLAENSTNTATAPTATIIKVGNVKVSLETETGAGNYHAVSGRVFVMFVPQGMTPTPDYPQEHPEYVMCWKAFNPTDSTVTTIMSKLKRNLNSGDKLICMIQVINHDQTSIQFKPMGVASYVCRAN